MDDLNLLLVDNDLLQAVVQQVGLIVDCLLLLLDVTLEILVLRHHIELVFEALEIFLHLLELLLGFFLERIELLQLALKI